MFRNFALITLLFAVACDDAPRPELREAEDDDVQVDRLAELVAEERWDDGLEEFLDPACGEATCPWGWARALEGLTDELLPIPMAQAELLTDLAAPRPSAAAKTVKVTYVHCFETQDVGDDEPYLLLNGAQVWSATGVKNGVSYTLNKSATTTVLVELWERDVSTNDKIGSFSVTSTKANGNYSTSLTGAGGSYKVYYTVSG